MSVRSAAQTGNRELLEAMRDLVADQLDEGVNPRDLAALTRRLMEINRELQQVEASQEGDDIGEAAHTADEAWPAS